MIGRKVTLAFGVSQLKNVAGFVSLFFVARLMGPEALGIVSFGFAYVGLFNIVADMGFGVAHIKKVSEGRDLPRCLGAYLLIRIVLTVLMVLAVGYSVYFCEHVLGRPFESPLHKHVIYLAAASLLVLNLANVPGVTFAARKETARQLMPELLSKITEAGLKVAVAILGLGVLLLAGASLAGAVVCLVAYGLLFRGYRFARPDRGLIFEYIRFALPITVIVSATTITEYLDQVMLQFFWHSEELGYYVGAGRIGAVFMMAGVAIGTLIFPTVSALHSEQDQAGILRLVRRAEKFSALLLFPVGVLVSYNSSLIMRVLLGASFERSGALLTVLTWSTIVYVLSVPYSSQIIGTNRERLSAALSVALMLVNVALNLVLVPRQFAGIELAGLGALGASCARLAANLIMAGLYRGFALRGRGLWPGRDTVMVVVAAAAMAGGLELAGRLGGGSGWAGALITLLGLPVYGLALYLTRAVSGEELRYLLNTFSPGQMARYVAGEIKPGPPPETPSPR
jgi:O-antigen/teichoic acid export membrane protein